MGPIGEDSRMVKWDPEFPPKFEAAEIFGAPLKAGMFFFFFEGGGVREMLWNFCLSLNEFTIFLIFMVLYTFSVMHLTALRRLSREGVHRAE